MIEFLLTLFLVLFVSFGLYIVVPSLLKMLLRRKSLDNIDRSQPVLYLTFDDGPDPLATPAILDLLREYDARATFFVTGNNLMRNRKIGEQILVESHSLGEHGYFHIHPWKSLPAASWREVTQSDRAITEALPKGQIKVLHRPPFGKFNLVTLLYSIRKRRKIVFWDIDPKDYACDSPDDIASHVLSKARPGSVILLHDARGNLRSSDVRVTVEALRLILPEAKSRGFHFAAL